jgi:hypothetical protein
MASDRQLLVVSRTRDGTVDVGEVIAVWLVPHPNLRRCIVRFITHLRPPDILSFDAPSGCRRIVRGKERAALLPR